MRIRKAIGLLLTLLVVSVMPLAAVCETSCEPAMVRDCCAGMPGGSVEAVVSRSTVSGLPVSTGHCEHDSRGLKSRPLVSAHAGLMVTTETDCGAGLSLNAAIMLSFTRTNEVLRGEALLLVRGIVPEAVGSRVDGILRRDGGPPWLSRIEPFRFSFRV